MLLWLTAVAENHHLPHALLHVGCPAPRLGHSQRLLVCVSQPERMLQAGQFGGAARVVLLDPGCLVFCPRGRIVAFPFLHSLIIPALPHITLPPPTGPSSIPTPVSRVSRTYVYLRRCAPGCAPIARSSTLSSASSAGAATPTPTTTSTARRKTATLTAQETPARHAAVTSRPRSTASSLRVHSN